MFTLGLNAAYHDCSAALVDEGNVVAAAEEERFTHVKHGKRPVPFTTWQLPFNAIDFCLARAGIALRDVDHIAYSYDPHLLSLHRPGQETIALPLEPSARSRSSHDAPWEPLFLSYVVNAPRQLAGGVPHHLVRRLSGVGHADLLAHWHYVEHHLAHEASAFLAAPFTSCAILTMDGRGERATTSYGFFDGRDYTRIRQVDLPHSLGLLYEEVTRYLGFLHSSDEYKVMALASYGTPAFASVFEEVLEVTDDGGYEVRELRLERRFGPPRVRGGPLEQRHFDIARSLQEALERATLKMVDWLHRQTGAEQLAMAGGVALNCVMNSCIRDRGPFRDVWVQPAAGDAGTALGAALWIDRTARRARDGRLPERWVMNHAYLGPEYSDAEIASFLRWAKVPVRRLYDVAGDTAALLARNRVVGWFQGRMEFGPRALGARSILASPIDPEMQQRLNEIKDREDFRPVAPIVLEERAHDWFLTRRRSPPPLVAPFMLFVFDILTDKEARIPAVRHVDGTARVQTVSRHQNPLMHAVLTEFERRTGVPVLINTSFNTRGEPIVCTPRDAVESFFTSPLDALVIGPYLIEKATQ